MSRSAPTVRSSCVSRSGTGCGTTPRSSAPTRVSATAPTMLTVQRRGTERRRDVGGFHPAPRPDVGCRDRPSSRDDARESAGPGLSARTSGEHHVHRGSGRVDVKTTSPAPVTRTPSTGPPDVAITTSGRQDTSVLGTTDRPCEDVDRVERHGPVDHANVAVVQRRPERSHLTSCLSIIRFSTPIRADPSDRTGGIPPCLRAACWHGLGGVGFSHRPQVIRGVTAPSVRRRTCSRYRTG